MKPGDRWPWVPIRKVARLGTGHTPSRQHPEYWENCTIPWLTLADVGHLRDPAVSVVSKTEELISELGLANSAAELHPAGTVVLSRTASVGFSAILGRDMATSQDFATWTCGPGVMPRFLLHALRGQPDQIERRKMGSTHQTIYMPDIKSLETPLPPVATQRAIADYLDRETARIDALIQAKDRMLGLLRERWMTVRRLLAEEKPSSTFIQLRRIARLQAGAAFPHERQGDTEGTVPYIKVGDLSNVDQNDRLCGASNYVTPSVAAVLRSPILPAETIVLPKIGAALLTNRRAILSQPSCLDQNVMGVTVEVGNPKYVYYCLAGIDLGDLSTPGPVPLLNEDNALSVRIPWPPREQQDERVRTLDNQRRAILAPAGILERQMDLLRERRQGLVSAAVTGQLDIPATE